MKILEVMLWKFPCEENEEPSLLCSWKTGSYYQVLRKRCGFLQTLESHSSCIAPKICALCEEVNVEPTCTMTGERALKVSKRILN
jgi:hypothetical protein